MTRSPRYTEAVRAFETWRYEQRVKPPDLFAAAAESAASASEVWKAEALRAIEAVALQRAELTVEDVPFSATYDNRSRGSAMQAAAKRGWIKPLGWVSGDKGRHGRPVRLWASRIYGGPDA